MKKPQYRVPPDPRKTNQYDPRPGENTQGEDDREPIPWIWLGMGVIVTLLGITLAAALVSIFLFREPVLVSAPTPTIIFLTAPPSPLPSSTPPFPAATPIPTFTPPPTPDLSIAPDAITVGYYAMVANTEDVGVSLRGGPSTDNIRLQLIPEGTPLYVIAGPEEANGFIWWNVRLDDDTDGWVAGDFLIPAAAPDIAPE